MKKSLLTLLLASLFLAGSASAESTAQVNRLERIKETKILVAGYREQSIPFSYLNNGKPSGFGVELTERVTEAVRQKINAPDVRIRWNAVTLSTRYPLMTTNTLDISCATDTHTKAREEQVSFSNTFYITRTSMVVAKDLKVKTLADLQGKRLAAPAGSSIENKLKSAISEKGWNMTVVPVRSNSAGMELLLNGKVDALGNAHSLLTFELFLHPESEKYEVLPAGQYKEAYACLLPKGDNEFKKLVDDVLASMMQSGEMEALYKKWFNQPIQPFGKNLNMPMNEATQALYKAPNDTPLE
jgi:glutamate/aspartate transport system substrate-binding protein